MKGHPLELVFRTRLQTLLLLSPVDLTVIDKTVINECSSAQNKETYLRALCRCKMLSTVCQAHQPRQKLWKCEAQSSKLKGSMRNKRRSFFVLIIGL